MSQPLHPAAADAASAEAELAIPEDAVEVGRIVGAWGLKGGIKVKPFSSDPQALFSSKRWFLRPAQIPRPPPSKGAAALPGLLRVVDAREQGEAVVATVRDIEDRDAAQALVGARIFVPRSSFPTPATDEFYWVDLIGLVVRNRQSEEFGTIVGLIETGPTCVLRVQPADATAEERLIPFVSAYVDQVDLAARFVLVDWPAEY